MKSLKAIFFIATLLILCACQTTRWAEIDTRKIEVVMKDIARDQNKRKIAELQAQYDANRQKKEELSDLISRLKQEEQIKCGVDEKKSGSMQLDRFMSSDPVLIGTTEFQMLPDDVKSCIRNIKNTESILTLEEQYKQLIKFMDPRKDFDGEIRKISKIQADRAIKEYAADRYYLVINKKSNDVVYSASNIKVDITEAVIDYIKNNKPDLIVKHFVEWSEPAPIE